MYKQIVKEIITNFINNEGYEESQIEKKIDTLIREQIENISSLNVYFVVSGEKIKIRVILDINKIHDKIRCECRFDKEFILNGKRKIRLKKILE